MDQITGKTLIDMGHKPGAWFPKAIEAAERVRAVGGSDAEIHAAIATFVPPPALPLRASGTLMHRMNISPEGPDEIANVQSVVAHMTELMRVPTIVAGAVMPDACPSGSAPGTVPVGGIAVAKEAIHPGMHSADICCSMAVSFFGRDADPRSILDAGMRVSHFGGGGRSLGDVMPPPVDISEAFAANAFLRGLIDQGRVHFGTQGDGNHFFFVGRSARTDEVALVTHHGSRGPGASLYKAGMKVAERFRQKLSPETPGHNAWIPSETREGEDYWAALQSIRAWTKASHFAIHDRISYVVGHSPTDRFWNEHNFVFRKSDGLFYHAKGATPAWPDFAADSSGLTLIPLNMAEPVLIARGLNAENALGFSPHGAGRNFSRTTYLKRHVGKTAADMIAEQAPGIDVRFFCGVPDTSELPLAYKDAASMRRQIENYGLAEIVDTIEPFGSIMAGDWQQDAPWRKKASGLKVSEELSE